jgi:hypothetical protein
MQPEQSSGRDGPLGRLNYGAQKFALASLMRHPDKGEPGFTYSTP